MSERFQHTPASGGGRTTTVSSLEPHVSTFVFRKATRDRFVFPFQIITSILIALTILSVYLWLMYDYTTLAIFTIWAQVLIIPFYLPGILMYFRLRDKEKYTWIELDSQNKLIQYKQKNVNILFHQSQIIRCELRVSIMLPHEVDFLVLHLKGGIMLCISSLIMDPWKFLHTWKIPYTTHRRWINTQIPQTQLNPNTSNQA